MSERTPEERAPEERAGAAPAGERVLADQVARHARRRTTRRAIVWAGRIGLAAGAVVAWELASGTLIRPFFVSSPSAVAGRLAEWALSPGFWAHARFTLTSAALGFLAGALLGVLLAWPLALRRVAYRVVEPYFLIAYSVPAVALGPVFILWFGIGLTPKVVLAAYFVFFVVFINTVEGIRQVPQGLIDVTRVLGGDRWVTMRSVLLPGALPYVLAAFRVTLPAAMIGAVVGEFIASNRGIGYLTRAAAGRYQTAGVIAGTIVLAAIVLLLSLALRPLSRVLRWRPEVRLRGEEVS
ncbi:NitT/TauT family transport system permease protein [Nonomuraea thailandensis]|uniref:NitT/TauT family transport system permease protein n=1 Tax=Nonomuraea thailandensis TaxID=1188745 RepID=A0A9X2GMA0_9ACTN|nr:ABC transporter permease [Nonomuraea thailandensis]MCP2360290.1 NitT/TauT family transport system permease protein [Nonomuraea thailandensis]